MQVEYIPFFFFFSYVDKKQAQLNVFVCKEIKILYQHQKHSSLCNCHLDYLHQKLPAEFKVLIWLSVSTIISFSSIAQSLV